MINLVIDILKANTTLTALVPSTRIYPLIQLQGGTIPAVVVQLTSTNPNDTQDRVSEYDDNAVQITSIADNPAEAWAISEAVRGAIDGYTGGSIAQIRFRSQATDIFEGTEVFSVTQGYSCHLKRDGATLPIAIAGLGLFNLDDIADVDTSGVTDGQVISYDAATSTWVSSDVAATLVDLTDTNIVDPLDRQALVYDEATSQWIADGVGQVVIPVRNPSRDDSIAIGTVLKATGAQGDRILVAPFEPDTDDMKYLVGIASEVLGNTNDTKDGHAQVYGELRDLNTDLYDVGTILYAAAGGTLSTTENQYPIAIVTRKQENTGRIFIRMWTPGKGYHQRYRTEADAELIGGVELYYTATADGDGFVTQDLTATPADGNVEERVLRYKSGAFGDSSTAVGYTDASLATDATYAEMVTAFNNLLKTETPPLTIYATRAEVASRSGLLADYPGAAAAYSLRLLDTDYTGSAIRVRRASDNAEQDIGFDGNGDLDTSALATFCSGTDGFVKVWYDQSGNNNDATQTTTANQPKIYDSATGVVTDGGIPALLGSVPCDMFMSSVLALGNYSIFASSTVSSVDMLYGGTLPTFGLWYNNGIIQRFDNNTDATLNFSLNNGDKILSYQNRASGTWSIAKNGGAPNTGTNSAAFTIDRLFAGYGTTAYSYAGKAQELIFYSSDQSANRTGIESNIATYYGITI